MIAIKGSIYLSGITVFRVESHLLYDGSF